MKTEVLFIYNAKSDIFSKAVDFAHKIISPQTYQCNLCAITYGNFSVHKEWLDFITSYNLNVKFLYADDFGNLFPDEKTSFPVVYQKNKDGTLNQLIATSEINDQKKLSDLIQLVKTNLKLN